jgi:hypothetical protein
VAQLALLPGFFRLGRMAVRKSLMQLSLMVALFFVALPALADCFTTGMVPAQTQNSLIAAPTGPHILVLAAAVNYDASNAKVAMVFDSATLPANGAIPVLVVPLAAALSATQPTPGSFSLPAAGVKFQNGIVFALSTTAKTLTVDTTSGGNGFFEGCWQ